MRKIIVVVFAAAKGYTLHSSTYIYEDPLFGTQEYIYVDSLFKVNKGS